MDYLVTFFILVNEMSPFLLIGLLMAGLLHVYAPKKLFTTHLSQPTFRSVFWAALLGVPLPLCSCGVIPTALSLRKEGASKGATVSFLIATPQTGVDSIFASYGLLGLPFAIIRPFVALITALFGGSLVNYLDKKEVKEVATPSCCSTPPSFFQRHSFLRALHYGYVEMLQDIGKWLIFGLVVAALITLFVPKSFFTLFPEYPILNMFLILLLSIPMYLCSTGSIPIAAALMLKGVSPGAALVLLMAGPVSNISSLLIIHKAMGVRTLIYYLLTIVLGAIGFGLLIDAFLPTSWFLDPLKTFSDHCSTGHLVLWKSICSILLVSLLIYSFWQKTKVTKKVVVPNQVLYKVKGMRCNHCKNNVEKELQLLADVTSVTVDLQAKEVAVVGSVDETKIKACIESLGYEFLGKKEA